MRKVTLSISILLWVYTASAQEKYDPEIYKSQSEYLKENRQKMYESSSITMDTLIILVTRKGNTEIPISTNDRLKKRVILSERQNEVKDERRIKRTRDEQ